MAISTTVIITSYNNKNYLGRAIRSCLKQSLKSDHYEIIVVDDCSTDNSKDVLVGFKDKITTILLDENVGVAEASNIGIRNALGNFIIRVDSDDYISENTLLFMSQILQANPDIGFVYADHIRVDENESNLGRVNLDTPEKIFRHGAGIMMRKSHLEKLGLYDKVFRNAEDHELLSRYLKNFNGFRIPIPLYRYRQLETSITHNDDRKKWIKKI